MFVLADVGGVTSLNARLNNIWPTSKDLTIKLFVNNIVPSSSDIASTYTEASGGNYTSIDVVCGTWTVEVIAGIATATAPSKSFVFTGVLTNDASIYGYYIVDGNGILQWSERLLAPFTPLSNGGTLIIQLVVQQTHGTPVA